MSEKKSTGKSSARGVFRSKSKAKEPEMVTIREEKKSLVRVIKAKPKAIKHMSEVLETKSVSAEEMSITEAVVQRVVSSPEPPNAPKVIGSATSSKPLKGFACVECGARVPEDSPACPRCHARYLRNLTPEAVAELERAVASAADARRYADDDTDDLKFDEFPIIHFDAMDGMFSYLEHDDGKSDFVLECSHCGTLIQLDIDRCPLCGAALEATDVGLLNLLKDCDFGGESGSELECPNCGEHVTLEGGSCPKCGSVIIDDSPTANEKKVIPLIKTENVVFVHIDLETGDLNYLQRHLNRVAVEHMSIQLDGIGNGGFNEDWHSLSRI
jgi:RNA polymerase subunit RPABC4/transcription elongation factor Spt4